MTRTHIKDILFLIAFYIIVCGAEGWVELLL